ncbi:MAG: DUF3575 domain-containing protein [Crocinitomicaceae bacterium]
MKKTLMMCVLLASTAVYGQKNAVKLVLAPGKLALANNIGLMYERKLTDRFSASAKFNFSSKAAAPLSGQLSDFAQDKLDSANTAADIFNNKFNSSGFTLELRYYTGAKALKGFYLAPYFGIQKGTFADFDFQFPDKTNPSITRGGNVEMGFNFVGGGLGLGNQWTIANKIAIDILWIGLGVGSNTFGVTGTELPGEDVDFEQVDSDVKEFIDSQEGALKTYFDRVESFYDEQSIQLTSKNLVPYTKFLNFSIGYCF